MISDNLVLIGMPGVGKSTIGVLLAKHLGLDFVDTDLCLQRQTGLRLQQIINQQGLQCFRRAEEQMLLGLHCKNSVIATGGSVIYSAPGMKHLKELGPVLYLQISLQPLTQRIADTGQRGLVIETGQSFADLYTKRTPLYMQYADKTINIDGLSIASAMQKIVKIVKIG